MNDKRHPSQPEPGEGFNVGDVYFVLFRQKWIILAFCVLGFAAAGVVSVINPPQYESEAKLYIQYLKSVNSKNTQPGEDTIKVAPGGRDGDSVQDEIIFLTSLDVADEVVERVGADRILSKLGGGEDTNAAARVVLGNLITDDVPKSPSVLRIAFQNLDNEVARDVLRAIVEAYLRKSDAMHSVEMPQELLTNDVEEYRSEVADAEKKLSKLKQEAGIISTLDETRKNLSERYEQVSRELRDTQVELAGVGTDTKAPATNGSTPVVSTNQPPEPPQEAMIEYQTTRGALTAALNELMDAKGKYPESSPLLEGPRSRVHDLTEELNQIQEKYPQIESSTTTVVASTPSQSGGAYDGMIQALHSQQLLRKVSELRGQLDDINADRNRVDASAAQITELEEKWKFRNDLLKASLDRLVLANGANHPEFSQGIKITENPTPAVRKRSKQAKKMIVMAFGGCVGAGILLAFFIEMVLDRSVKRPAEIEAKLKLPLFISIPDINGNGHRRVPALAGANRALLNENNSRAMVKSNGQAAGSETEEIAVWDSRHGLHKFYSGLRDRLIVNFEVRNLNHNPKLVGVTSCNRGAGVSTIATGLAASLSETGDGNVLLVDMRGKEGASQQFYKGKPVVGLDAALGAEKRNGAHVHDNLYEAGDSATEGDMPSLSKRFATLMPKLKASDYDYIIFDMPPVSQTSMTARLSGLMDMVLLVIESEKTNRDSVKRATALLKESKAHISTVLNKLHTYVPTRLHQEYLDDEA